MAAGRPYVFPDPNYRSPIEPGLFVDGDTIIGLYNQEHPDEDNMKKMSVKVREWFTAEAKNQGWDNVIFAGSQCLIVNDAVAKCKKE